MKKVPTYWYIATAIFTIIYVLISIVNHYYFRTATLDLGLYTHNMYDYLRFGFADTGIFKCVAENQLSDHFDIYLILFSPFTLVFKTYTLLIIQIIAVVFGSLGIYKLIYIYSDNKKHAFWASVFFMSFFAVFSALSFDYHSSVVATMLVPWFLIYVKKKNFKIALLFLVLILISKENISLWMFFVCTGFMWEYRKDKVQLKNLAIFSTISIAYFILIVWMVMPALSSSSSYAHFDFTHFGASPTLIIANFFSSPISFIQDFFSNHSQNPHGYYIKTELLLYLLLSGGIFAMYKFQYFWMMIPIIMQKFMHNNINMWGVGFHYNIEFTVILTLAVFTVLWRIKQPSLRQILLFTSLLLSITITIRSMDSTLGYNDKKRLRFYQAQHYEKGYNVKEVHQALNEIPKDASVSAISVYTPHLSLRDNLYTLPCINDAEYIVFSTSEKMFPYSEEEYLSFTSNLLVDSAWVINKQINDFYILKKK
jgi:uncharacterized membrane protein